MRGSDKKSRSREAFAAVFEEQTRRFSPFELLGIAPAAASPTPPPSLADTPPSEWPAQGVEEPDIEPAQTFGPDHTAQALRPDGLGEVQGPDHLSLAPQRSAKIVHSLETYSEAQALRPDPPVQAFTTEGLSVVQTLDPQQDQTPDPLVLGRRVRPSLGQTRADIPVTTLGTDRRAQELLPDFDTPLLAPLQWAVWESLQEADAAGRTVSYRQLAKQTKSTIDGVRKAVRVLQKEGGICAKETVRTAQEQGFRVVVNRDISFRRGTLNEAKAILKRGLTLGQTPDRLGGMLRPEGLRMFVCRNTNIKQTDIAPLLRVPPSEWNIREQTLIQIADTLPEMTAIEFRLSLAYLVEQAKQAKEPIRNPNAWVKAAFEKNRRPLVTEREIEARFEQSPLKRDTQSSEAKGEGDREELDLLRRYLACGVNERAEIDGIAEEKAAPLFKVVAADKHAGVMNAARLEAIREYFGRMT
jgi:O6-methylguanine-DNA--protein-cysteine methyltransferase